MASGRSFAAEQLMPSTIFDRDPDMDVSEEMEEIREVLYALIKAHFPMGVSSTHLAEKYNEEYVGTGMGKELPNDWLEQVAAAEEFETQIRGPLTILFVRLSNTSSFRRSHISNTNLKITAVAQSEESSNYPESGGYSSPKVSPGLPSFRKSPRDLATQLEYCIFDNDWHLPKDVIVTHITSPNDFFIGLANGKFRDDLRDAMNDFYDKHRDTTKVQIHEVCVNGAYAVLDAEGNWHRATIISCESGGMARCAFVDSGRSHAVPVDKIRFLSCPQADSPSLAIRCSLDILDRVNEKTEPFRDLLFEEVNGVFQPKVIKASFMDDVKKSIRIVKLTMSDGRDIKSSLAHQANSEKENQIPAHPSSTSRPVSTTSISPMSISAPLFCFQEEPEIQPMKPSEMPNNSFLAHALFAAGPSDISMRQASLDPMPDYMYEKLADECLSPAAILTETPVQGAFYAAFIDERWERVICVRGSKIDPASFCVYLIDVGAFHYVRGEAMRKLNSKTPFKKMLMFKAKVAGIAPIGGADIWARESHLATREFFEATMGEPVEVNPQCSANFPKSGKENATRAWSKWKQLNAPSVPVIEARISCAGRDLADWLIACGLAVPVPIK